MTPRSCSRTSSITSTVDEPVRPRLAIQLMQQPNDFAVFHAPPAKLLTDLPHGETPSPHALGPPSPGVLPRMLLRQIEDGHRRNIHTFHVTDKT